MIKKITIEVNKKKIELSLEEAKKLHKDLDEMFRKNQIDCPPQPQSPWCYNNRKYWEVMD